MTSLLICGRIVSGGRQQARSGRDLPECLNEDCRMDYRILMDVSGDISPSFAEEQQIGFLPMEYTIGGENRELCGMESPEILRKFYNGQRSGDLTQTTQITPGQYEEYFENTLRQGFSILYLCLSSGLSSTYDSACLAAETLREKYPDLTVIPIDTLAATGGMGVLGERAARNKNRGMSLLENAADLREAVHHIQHQFMVQDLMYLRRGGRISGAEAVLGTALSIRPVMKIDETGKLVVIEKKRGNKMAVRALLEEFEKHYDAAGEDVIYIIDGDADDTAETLRTAIREKYPDAVIRRAGLSPIIGAHTGPGMAAVIYMGK